MCERLSNFEYIISVRLYRAKETRVDLTYTKYVLKFFRVEDCINNAQVSHSSFIRNSCSSICIHILVRNRVEIYFQEKYFYSNIKILYSNIYTEDDKKGPDDPSFKNLWVRVLSTLVHQNSYIH